ncbi:ankyrin repeat domain-containing protein SOWAHA [Ascaphus truei]|uniref:ankyrin repeat domain-containing protein SOWAHA n=1 Tax=Ascaphus truei TaxID=8439 RepID=UPI003F5A6A46
MAVSREIVLNFLLEQGGKVKNADLLRKFKPLVDSPDPNEKASNRELFKLLVNNLAVVKDEDGVKFVVLKKKHLHLVAGGVPTVPMEQDNDPGQRRASPEERAGGAQLLPTSQQESKQGEAAPSSPKRRSSQQGVPWIMENQQAGDNMPVSQDESLGGRTHPAIGLSESMSLKESGSSEASTGSDGERESVFAIVSRMDHTGPAPAPKAWADGQPREPAQKPVMLPLRYPQRSLDDKEGDPGEQSSKQGSVTNTTTHYMAHPAQHKSPHVSRRLYDDTGAKSPHIKRSSKVVKVSEENKYSDVVPLEATEHEWLVKATSGRWNHRLHGLLLTDSQLAEKRDFMSGFTALHWAAKGGIAEVVSTLIEVAKKGGTHLNVNVKSYGGYTPLHIAAIHDKKDVIIMLVRDYNATVHIRDHSGKKPYQYLNKGSSLKIRSLLNDPQSNTAEQVIPIKRTSKVATSILGTTSAFLGVLSDDMPFHDLAKGLKKPGPLNKFFTAPTAQRKKSKARDSSVSVSSFCEEEEQEEPVGKRRPVSEFFNH